MAESVQSVDIEALKAALGQRKSTVEFLGLPPALPGFLYALALGHFESQRTAVAKQTCVYLTVLDPFMPEAWGLLGNCFMRDGEFREALDAWSQSMYLKPNYLLALQVTRTAIALKDLASAGVGLLEMSKHATQDEQYKTVDFMADELRELLASVTKNPETASASP